MALAVWRLKSIIATELQVRCNKIQVANTRDQCLFQSGLSRFYIAVFRQSPVQKYPIRAVDYYGDMAQHVLIIPDYREVRHPALIDFLSN